LLQHALIYACYTSDGALQQRRHSQVTVNQNLFITSNVGQRARQ